jgi:membrane associated rhomboid family serine protease
MSYAYADESDYPRITPAVQWLIGINVVIYFLQLTVVSAPDMQGALGFQLRDLSRHPWKALTYMFAHRGFWHLAGNMYMLWLFGPRVEHAWRVVRTPAQGSQSFTYFYLWCGLGGWLTHLLFVRGGLLLGASAAVYGVMLAYAMRWPNDEIYFFGVLPLKVKWLVIGYVAWDVFAGMISLNGGAAGGTAYLAHVGGFAFGWLWLRTPSTQSLDRIRQRISPVDEPDETPRAIPRPLPRPPRERSEIEDIIARSKAAVAKREPREPREPARPPVTVITANKKEALNLVLDKISEKGLHSLTAEERRLLEEMSRRLRARDEV